MQAAYASLTSPSRLHMLLDLMTDGWAVLGFTLSLDSVMSLACGRQQLNVGDEHGRSSLEQAGQHSQMLISSIQHLHFI